MRLVANLGEWKPLQVVGALLASLAAVSLFVVLVGLVLLPADMEQIRQPLYSSIIHCHMAGDPERAVSLVWYMPLDAREGWRHRLVSHGLAGQRPALEFVWPQLCPSSAAAGRSPDELFVGCWDGKLWKLNLAQPGSAPQPVGQHSELAPHLIACSKDGRWLASLGPHCLQVLDLASGRPVWSLEQGKPRCFALHPDCERMLVTFADGCIAELALATGEPVRTLALQCESAMHAECSPDGRLVAIISAVGDLNLVDWESGRSAWPADWRDCPHALRSSAARFSPSGQWLVTGGSDTTSLAVWNLRTMQLAGELRGHDKSVNGMIFLDEQRVCSFGADGTIRIWDLTGRSPPRVLTLDVTPQAG